MPIDLYGKFWTVPELSDQLEISYQLLSRALMNREGTIKIGQTFLIPDELVKFIVRELGVEEKLDSVSITALARALNVQIATVTGLVKQGIPCYNVNGKKRIQKKIIPFLEEAVREIVDREGFFPSSCIPECYGRTMELMEQSRND